MERDGSSGEAELVGVRNLEQAAAVCRCRWETQDRPRLFGRRNYCEVSRLIHFRHQVSKLSCQTLHGLQGVECCSDYALRGNQILNEMQFRHQRMN